MRFYFSNDYQNALDPETLRNSVLRQSTKTVDNTVIIDIKGMLEPSCASAYEELGIITSYQSIIKDLQNLDSNVDEVIFCIDSIGGSTRLLKETADLIKETGKTKHTVAYIRGVCASAAYYLASACNTVLATDSGEIGSIGTICLINDSDSDKIKVFVSTGTDYKVRTAENKEIFDDYIQGKVDRLANEFRSFVSDNRPLTNAEECFSGKMFSTSEAVNLGLIDGVLSIVEFNKIINNK